MTSSKHNSLIEVIEKEARLVGEFVAVLEREQAVLASGEIDSLDALLAAKNDLAVQLEAVGAQRNSLLISQGLTADPAGMQAWCEQHQNTKASSEFWPAIVAGAREAMRLNRLNGELIRLRLQYNERALEALRRGDDSLNLYGPNGQSTAKSGVRLDDAV